MIYKVGILGATGRMGLEIAALLTPAYQVGQDSLELADAVSASRKLSHIEGVPVRGLQDPLYDPVHVWIDFSHPSATLELLETAETPVVIGTTGFSEGQVEKIRLYSQRKPVLMAPNMSPGMNLMMKMLKAVPVSAALGFNDVVLNEAHHREKKDSPSGTAKSLLSILESNGNENVQVQVIRAGTLRGEHQVRFVSDDEEILLQHRVSDRRVFARGALIAAHFLVTQKRGLYSMQDLEVC